MLCNLCPTQGRVMRCDEAHILKVCDITSISAATPDAPSQKRMKLTEMNETSVEKWWNKYCYKGKMEITRGKPTQTQIRLPRNQRECTETRTRDLSGLRRATNRMRQGYAYADVHTVSHNFISSVND